MATRRVNYTQRMKAIKSYVDFSYSKRTTSTRRLTRKQKYKITQYYNEIGALKNRPYKISRPGSKTKLRTAQKYSGQRPLKHFRVAFVPIGQGKAKIRYKKGKIYVEQEHVTTTDLLFNPEQLATDPIQHTKDIIAGSSGKSFNIMAGRYEIPYGYDRSSLPGAINSYVSRYSQEFNIKGSKKVLNNHYWGNWLFGVRAHEFKKQSTFNKYNADKKRAIDSAKRKNKKKRG